MKASSLREFYVCAPGAVVTKLVWIRGTWPTLAPHGRQIFKHVSGYFLQLTPMICEFDSTRVRLEILDGNRYFSAAGNTIEFARDAIPDVSVGNYLIWERMMKRAEWLEQNCQPLPGRNWVAQPGGKVVL